MNTEPKFDFDAALSQIVAMRPRQPRGESISFDVVTWGIRMLEEFGIHPSLRTIAMVVGVGGSQRTLVPLVNRFYLERASQASKRPPVDSDEHLVALYECVASRVKKQVEERLADEHREVAEAYDQLEQLRSAFQAEREEASRQLLLAEAIRMEVQEELGRAREERLEIQMRAEGLSKAIGELQGETRELNSRNELLGKQNAILASKLDASTTSVNKLSYELARSGERETSLVKSLRERNEALDRETAEANELRLALQASETKSRAREQQHAELAGLHKRATSELERAQAKLARERATSDSVRSELRVAKASALTAEKRAVRARRDLQAMTSARERAAAVAESAAAEGHALLRRSERLEARLALMRGRRTDAARDSRS